jgi:hypothetical protein
MPDIEGTYYLAASGANCYTEIATPQSHDGCPLPSTRVLSHQARIHVQVQFIHQISGGVERMLRKARREGKGMRSGALILTHDTALWLPLLNPKNIINTEDMVEYDGICIYNHIRIIYINCGASILLDSQPNWHGPHGPRASSQKRADGRPLRSRCWDGASPATLAALDSGSADPQRPGLLAKKAGDMWRILEIYCYNNSIQ